MRFKVDANRMPQSIGDVAPGAIVLGRTYLVGGARAATTETLASPRLQSSATQRLVSAGLAAPKPVATPVKTVRAPAPVAPVESGGVPTPVLIGGGVVLVLALAAVAYKFTR